MLKFDKMMLFEALTSLARQQRGKTFLSLIKEVSQIGKAFTFACFGDQRHVEKLYVFENLNLSK